MIAGIDEAGRGALAGPVVAACVVFLDKEIDTTIYKDSKQLNHQKRLSLLNNLKKSNTIINWSIINHKTIDKKNILKATLIAMENCIQKLSCTPTKIIIDGNKAPTANNYLIETCVNGDKLINEISAASIVAKVIRDTIMSRYHKLFPNYCFNKHKGYGTKEHYDALAKYGPCKIHRKTFNLNTQLTLF
ncbi:ribonuclease HII [bacterium]|nr:ribonuclease HII [bacterium]|tara:strand:+ start:44 stop:610 length:567 start_codon:yes stop_codon:yes gene_type:complete